MTSYNYLEVLRPRYNGTWNLHRHGPADLDFFLMLSSISGVIGNATQAAYAAGSAFMDSFAAYRNTLGLPAISLDLGTVTDVGYLATNKELATKMARQGFQGTDKKTLLSLIQVAISQPTKVGNAQIITGLGEWKEGESLGNFDAPLFAHFRRRFRRDGETADSKDAVEILRGALRASKSQDEAIPVIYEALSGKISSRLGISVERIDPASPLSEFGVDSHVAVELRNWINKTMDSAVSILEILASDSVLQLVGHIAGRSSLIEGTNIS
jgi:acyl carrier protein